MVLFGASPSCWQSFTNNLSSNGGDSFRGWQQYVASLTSNKKRLSARRRQTFMVVDMHLKKSVAKWCRKICLTQSWHHQYLLKNLNIWTVHHYFFRLKRFDIMNKQKRFCELFRFREDIRSRSLKIVVATSLTTTTSRTLFCKYLRENDQFR